MAAWKRSSSGVTAVTDSSTVDCDVLTSEDCSGSEDEEEASVVGSDMPQVFHTLWEAALGKPYDFVGWIKLVKYAEIKKHLAACRKVYDKFLTYFPLCHVYWKKYAELEQQFGNEEETEKIYARAVKFNPVNDILWINYIEYLKKSTAIALTKRVDKLRGVFKEAVKACGMVFHSDKLWKNYMVFEMQQKNLKELTALYDRVLTIPTRLYNAHYESFKSYVRSHSPTEILSTEELARVCSELQIKSDMDSLTKSDIAKLQEQILLVRGRMHLLNTVEVNSRMTFEDGIERLYFNTTPMNVKQLENWRKYLDFEVSRGQHESIVVLYERCLMSCADYEEFWLSYAGYMEGHSVEAARSVFERACRIYLPQRSSLLLQWAMFEEKHVIDSSTMDCDVLTTEDCSGSEDEEEACVVPLEFHTLWEAALGKPYDFKAWTKVIEYAESEQNLAVCRKAYDKFFTHFPLCDIYWTRYADLEQQFGNEEATEKIYARAVKSNPLNVTLWINYIEYVKKTSDMSLAKCVDKLRGVFKEAVKACGMVFHSDELWKNYMEFEMQQKNLKALTALYDQVLTIPTQLYSTHYERFKSYVACYSPNEILSKEEWAQIRSKTVIKSDYVMIATEDSDDYMEPLTKTDTTKFRKKILRFRKRMHCLNAIQVEERRTFEARIKRLYFDTTPMTVKQLENWRRYLDFEVSRGHHRSIVLLYERCLMTCALYEEFWLLYAGYMERHSVEAARSVFERACRIHLPQKYSLHLQWAMFEEKHGCLDSARAILCHQEKVTPDLAIVRLKRVGLERRNGNLQEAERLLQEAVQMSEGTKLAGFYAVKLSRLILKLQKDPHKAKAVLDEALKKDLDNPQLQLSMLEFEMSRDGAKDAPLACLEQALKRNLSDETKKILCQRRLEYLDDLGSSLTSWMNAYTEHQTYLKRKGDKKKNKDKKKAKTDSEDCYPPGVPPPKIVKSAVPPKEDVSAKEQASKPIDCVSTANVPVVGNSAVSYRPQYPPTSEPCPSSHYYVPRPYVPPVHQYYLPPRTYGPPQNAPMQQFFRNQFPQPRVNVFPNFPPQPFFSGPSGPQFMDNSGMNFGIFNYRPWF